MLEANTLILSDTKSERGRAPLLAPDLWSCCSAASTAGEGRGSGLSSAPQLLSHKLAPALLENYF